MDGDGHTDDVGYQDEIAVGMGLVGTVLPFEDEPEHERRAERREGIDLALDGREPERVAPGIHQCTAQT